MLRPQTAELMLVEASSLFCKPVAEQCKNKFDPNIPLGASYEHIH